MASSLQAVCHEARVFLQWLLLVCKQVAMETPGRLEDLIPRSVLDKLFLGYYAFQIVSTLMLDMQGTLPAFIYPSWVQAIHTHHVETWRDPWLANTWRHPWYFSICMWEYFLHVPFYFLAAFTYFQRINGQDRHSWMRIPLIMYSTQTMTAVSSVVTMSLMQDFSSCPAPYAPSGFFQRVKLAGMYGTFFVFCLLNLLDAVTGRDYLPEVRQDARAEGERERDHQE